MRSEFELQLKLIVKQIVHQFQLYRYIVRRGSSGLYLYTILERLEGWPDVDMDQIRVVFKLQNAK